MTPDRMRILIVGRGGREHALVWALQRSPRVEAVWCAPGNAGIARMGGAAACLDVAEEDAEALVSFASETDIDLAVIGPEAPLLAGLADRFVAAGVPTFGPSRHAAEIEGSKVFAKDLCRRYGIPTAAYGAFEAFDEALAYLRGRAAPIVIKVDGLAAGKGVTVAATLDEAEAALREAMVAGRFGDAGQRVVIEDCLEGEELSLLAFVDGNVVRPMVASQDHKRAYDGDAGANTGGMGAYSPVPHVPRDAIDEAVGTILQPAASALVQEGRPFRGVLYAGLMLTEQGPQVIEFNARFGDPEAQVVLPRLESDLAEILWLVATGDPRLATIDIDWSEEAAVCVVAASGGYPGPYETGVPIRGLDDVEDALVFHAGTTTAEDGGVLTAGGRVLGVTALGADVWAARDAAYRVIDRISFEGMHVRRDIGHRAER